VIRDLRKCLATTSNVVVAASGVNGPWFSEYLFGRCYRDQIVIIDR
jgi:hypothetical protein